MDHDQPEEGMLELDREIKNMLALPKAEQNWDALALEDRRLH